MCDTPVPHRSLHVVSWAGWCPSCSAWRCSNFLFLSLWLHRLRILAGISLTIPFKSQPALQWPHEMFMIVTFACWNDWYLLARIVHRSYCVESNWAHISSLTFPPADTVTLTAQEKKEQTHSLWIDTLLSQHHWLLLIQICLSYSKFPLPSNIG